MRKKMERKPIRTAKFLGIWVNPKLKQRIIKFCEKCNLTHSAFVRDAIEEKLDREGF